MIYDICIWRGTGTIPRSGPSIIGVHPNGRKSLTVFNETSAKQQRHLSAASLSDQVVWRVHSFCAPTIRGVKSSVSRGICSWTKRLRRRMERTCCALFSFAFEWEEQTRQLCQEFAPIKLYLETVLVHSPERAAEEIKEPAPQLEIFSKPSDIPIYKVPVWVENVTYATDYLGAVWGSA